MDRFTSDEDAEHDLERTFSRDLAPEVASVNNTEIYVILSSGH